MKSDFTHQFKKDYKTVRYSGRYDSQEIDKVISAIINGNALEPSKCDHELTGNFKGIRECHVYPNLLLMYRYVINGVIFIRLGTHNELFG